MSLFSEILSYEQPAISVIFRFFCFENVHFEITRYNSWQMDNLFFVC